MEREEEYLVPKGKALDHAITRMLFGSVTRTPGLDKWRGATVRSKPLEIFDLNGQPLFYEFLLEKDGKIIGRVKASASKVLGPSVYTAEIGPRLWDADRAIKEATKVAQKKFRDVKDVSTLLVCYSYPRLGILVVLADPKTKEEIDRMILDVASYDIVPEVGPGNKFAIHSVYNSIPQKERRDRILRWEADDALVEFVKGEAKKAKIDIRTKLSDKELLTIEGALRKVIAKRPIKKNPVERIDHSHYLGYKMIPLTRYGQKWGVDFPVDRFSETNKHDQELINATHPADRLEGRSAWGQRFFGHSFEISSAKFYLKRTGNPTGSLHAVLYAGSGAYEFTAYGSPLATSNGVDPSAIGTGAFELVEFTFPTPYQCQSTDDYCIICQAPSSGTWDDSNFIEVGCSDQYSAMHSGNTAGFIYPDGWIKSDKDTCFYIYGSPGGNCLSAIATTQMILRHHNYYYEQEDIVPAMQEDCSLTHQLDGYRSLSHGYLCPWTIISIDLGNGAPELVHEPLYYYADPLTWDDVERYIDEGWPMAGHGSLASHYRVCSGYAYILFDVLARANGIPLDQYKRDLYIYDPWPSDSSNTFSNPQGGSEYWEDWYATLRYRFIYIRPCPGRTLVECWQR